MENFHALILAKGESTRLPNKNKLWFHNKPMFLWNVEKCLSLFDEVYVSSDDPDILSLAKQVGAIPIERGKELCGDIPNIPVYQHALKHMSPCAGIVCVQANSPTIDPGVILLATRILEMGVQELITVHKDMKFYGSVWAMTVERLEKYGDPYKPTGTVMICDDSIDIHTQEDLELALKQE